MTWPSTSHPRYAAETRPLPFCLPKRPWLPALLRCMTTSTTRGTERVLRESTESWIRPNLLAAVARSSGTSAADAALEPTRHELRNCLPCAASRKPPFGRALVLEVPGRCDKFAPRFKQAVKTSYHGLSLVAGGRYPMNYRCSGGPLGGSGSCTVT